MHFIHLIALSTSHPPNTTSWTSSPTNTKSSQSITNLEITGVSVLLLLLVLAVLIISVLVLLWNYKKKSIKQKPDAKNEISSYSVLNRGTNQQMQPHSLHAPCEVYDQIKLSPSTGQTELVHQTESENINNLIQPSHDVYHIHSSVETTKHVALQPPPPPPPQNADGSLCEQPTYAAVDKSKKKYKKQEPKYNQEKEAEKKGPLVLPYIHKGPSTADQEVHAAGTLENQTSWRQEDLQIVHKNPESGKASKEETVSPIPPHTVEDLYTVVKKKIKKLNNGTMQDDSDAPADEKGFPAQSHTADQEVHAVEMLKDQTVKRQEALQEMYACVNKDSKKWKASEDETAPPIPPHTVVELYTAVNKLPKQVDNSTIIEDDM